MAKHDNRCRSCKHYNLPAVLNAAGAVIPSRSAKCLWVYPKEWELPQSIRLDNWSRLPTPGHMEPNSGVNCKVWERRNGQR